MSSLMAEHATLSHVELMDALVKECQTISIPRNAGRTNLMDRPRSLLLGLYTRRGLGISKGTIPNLRALSLVHALARHRPLGGHLHPYCAVMLTRLDQGQCLSTHRDEYNALLNWVLPLASPTAPYVGGELWIEMGCPSDFAHRSGEAALDTDLFTETGVATNDAEEQCTIDERTGCLLGKHGSWVCFDSRRRHCVLEVTEGCRFSVALFSPTRLEHVPSHVWSELAGLGFDVEPLQRIHCTSPCPPAPASVCRNRRRRPVPLIGVLAGAASVPTAAAALLVADRGAQLRQAWSRALHGPHSPTFQPSRFCDFYRKERSALRAPSGSSAASTHCADAMQQWPCGWPFPEAELALTPHAVRPPRSRRRRARWQKWAQLKRYVNFKVCYLTWLHLGRPSHSCLSSPHPMSATLSCCQTAMCASFLAAASTKCRPTDVDTSVGSGLSLFRKRLEDLAGTYTKRPQTTGPAGTTVTITADNVSLPTRAGVVALDEKVLPKYMVDVLTSPDGLLMPAADRPRERPPMFVDVQDWPALASRLLNLNMVTLVEDDTIPYIDGQQCRAGLFGVPKATGELCRMIVDRRPRNSVEMDIRTRLLKDLVTGVLDVEAFTSLWALASYVLAPCDGSHGHDLGTNYLHYDIHRGLC
eukprot:996187-Amphidinium_carterae.2